MAVDRFFRPLEEEFMVLSRNISTKGICILYTEPIDANFLALMLPEDSGGNTQVVIEIVRTRRIERAYEFGGRFIRKLQ